MSNQAELDYLRRHLSVKFPDFRIIHVDKLCKEFVYVYYVKTGWFRRERREIKIQLDIRFTGAGNLYPVLMNASDEYPISLVIGIHRNPNILVWRYA